MVLHQPTIENSIVAANITVNGSGSDLNYSSAITSSVRNSLIGSNAGTPLQATTPGATNSAGNQIGTDATPIDPLLGALADNGGPTLTSAILISVGKLESPTVKLTSALLS